MRVVGTIELNLFKEDSSNLRYCCSTEEVLENLYLIEKENLAAFLFTESNELYITFQEEVADGIEHDSIVEKIKRSLGQFLFFNYDLDSNLKYWIRA